MDPFSLHYFGDYEKKTFNNGGNNGHGLKRKQAYKSSCLLDGEETLRQRLKWNVTNVLGKLDVFSFCVLKDHEMKGNMIQLCVISKLQGKLKKKFST